MDRWEELEDWVERMAARAHGVPVDWPTKTPNQIIELIRSLQDDVEACHKTLTQLRRKLDA